VNYPAALSTGVGATDTEVSTRARVARAVGEDGPVTASELASSLGITPAAVRRHLDIMLAEGLITEHTLPVGPRRRGRPAKAFVLTAAGHAALTNTYDDLAVSALRFIADRHGRDAVRAFAAERVAELEHRYSKRVTSAGDDVVDRVEALADALADDGYAATSRPVGDGAASAATADGDTGSHPAAAHATPMKAVQLCQGHCPVQHVATEFPELCEAEAEAFSRMLGVHVQRLATLAHGAHVCTTHVPVATPATQRTSTQQATTDHRPRQQQIPSGRTS
jgi:predicted ArsR family transcriptional regulator